MPDRWAILQHVAWEGPGTIASEVHARGLSVEVFRLDLDPCVPPASGLAGLIVMGGPMGAYDIQTHPHLVEECTLLAKMVELGRPVLGVCLGAQLLARALGAAVYPGPAPEVGFGFVELTAAGIADPVLGPAGPALPVFHWHGDTFDLPADAVLLASSAAYPHQAFRAGPRAYGLQCHVELDAGLWQAWMPRLPASAIGDVASRCQEIETAGRALIGRFFDCVLG